jgi:hypothetical protein
MCGFRYHFFIISVMLLNERGVRMREKGERMCLHVFEKGVRVCLYGAEKGVRMCVYGSEKGVRMLFMLQRR